MGELTSTQLQALQRLVGLADKFPRHDIGFWAGDIGDRYASVCRRALAPLGYVHIRRPGSHCFRYAITDLGRSALSNATTPETGGDAA